jgi:hypothetical protein
MFGVLDQFSSPVVSRFATEDAVQIVNPFITIPTTRNYNHSQLFITLCHIYTAYNHSHSWLQSLITLLHIYTGWLLSYQLLSQIITDFTSSHFETLAEILLREFTSYNWLVGLLLTNSLVELTSKDWLLRHFSSSYKPSLVQVSLQQRARWELCCVRSLCLHSVASETSVLPCDVIADCCTWTVFQCCCVTSSRLHEEDPASPTAAQRVLGREAFSGRLLSNALLRNPTMGWHVTILYIHI